MKLKNPFKQFEKRIRLYVSYLRGGYTNHLFFNDINDWSYHCFDCDVPWRIYHKHVSLLKGTGFTPIWDGDRWCSGWGSGQLVDVTERVETVVVIQNITTDVSVKTIFVPANSFVEYNGDDGLYYLKSANTEVPERTWTPV